MKFKSLISPIILTALIFGGFANAGVAIDGKEHKNTIPVAEANFTDVEAEVNFLKWKNKDAMNKLFHLTVLTPAGPMPTVRMNRDTFFEEY